MRLQVFQGTGSTARYGDQNEMRRISNKVKEQLAQPWFGGGMGAFLATIVAICLLLLPAGKWFRDLSYDLLFFLRSEKSTEDVVIVYLDEPSYRELNQKPTDFDRALHARLLRRLKAEGAKLVVFDILFIDSNRPPVAAEADIEFANALREHGKVVLGAQYHYDEIYFKNSVVLPPVEPLRQAAAGWGVARLHRDTDFSARRHHPGTDRVPSLAWKAAELAGIAGATLPGHRLRERWINYQTEKPFRGISYADLVLGKPLPPDLSLSNRVVFVGSSEVAGSPGDKKEEFRYPWTSVTGRFALGVEIHALTFDNLMRANWLSRLPIAVEIALILFIGVLLGFSLSAFRFLASTAIAFFFALVVVGVSWLLFVRLDVWVPWLVVVGAEIPVAFGWAYLFRSIKTYMEKRFLERSLELHLPKRRVRQILRRPELLALWAEEREVTLLFTDIADWSTISERLTPNRLFDLLNKYFKETIPCIHQADGMVIQLVGDAIFAVWNAPEDQPNSRELSCRAALSLRRKLIEFESNNESYMLRTRIGLHFGKAKVGNCGSADRLVYTALGTETNVASRIEGLNKHLNTLILASDYVTEKVAEGFDWRNVGRFRLKGADRVLEICELLSDMGQRESTAAWRDPFAIALKHFQHRRFDEAEAAFRQVMRLKPEDGPSAFYLKSIDEFRSNPPAPGWLGEIDLREK